LFTKSFAGDHLKLSFQSGGDYLLGLNYKFKRITPIMIRKKWFFLLFFISWLSVSGQHSIVMDAILDAENNVLEIEQRTDYRNTTGETLDTLVFLDWANSFSSKTTPLGLRFNEDYRRDSLCK